MHIKRWAAIPPRMSRTGRLRLRETNKYGAENIKRQNERNRKNQPKTEIHRKKENKP